jgi:hypothetical protein
MQRGITQRDRVIAAPSGRPFLVNQSQRLPFHSFAVPGAIRGEVLQDPPTGLQANRRQELGEGVLLPAHHHTDNPLDKPHPPRPGEGHGKRRQKRLPFIPQLASFAHDAPPLLFGNSIWPSPPEGCLVGSVYASQNPRNYCL